MDISLEKKLTFKDFQRKFNFGKYLKPYQLKKIEEYVKNKIPDRDWSAIEETYSFFEEKTEEGWLPAQIYEVCRWSFGPFGDESDRYTQVKRAKFFNSLKNVIEEINKIGEPESGLKNDDVIRTRNSLRTLLSTQLRYYREKDGSRIQETRMDVFKVSRQETPHKLPISYKADLALLLYLFQQIKKKKHPSVGDRERVARFFLFWNFEQEGKDYKEFPSEIEIESNNVLVEDLAERLKERYKKNLPYCVGAIRDLEEKPPRIRLFIDKLGKLKPDEKSKKGEKKL